MESKALNVVATIAAKLATGQLSLEAAEAFANSGELGEVVMLPTLGSVQNFHCFRCARPDRGGKEETPFVFGSEYVLNRDGGAGHTIHRWQCSCCKVTTIQVWDSRSSQKQ